MKYPKKLDDLSKMKIKSSRIQTRSSVFWILSLLQILQRHFTVLISLLLFYLYVSIFLKDFYYFSSPQGGQDPGLSPLPPSPPLESPMYYGSFKQHVYIDDSETQISNPDLSLQCRLTYPTARLTTTLYSFTATPGLPSGKQNF